MSVFKGSMCTEQQERLLYDHSNDIGGKETMQDITEPAAWAARRDSSLSNPTKCLAVHVLFTLGNIIIIVLCIWIYRPRSNLDSPVGLYDFYNDAIQPIVTKFHASGFEWHKTVEDRSTNAFEGPLTPSNNQAWGNLIKVGMVSLSRFEARSLPETTIEHPSMPGTFVYSIEVFHQLHCLDMIRRRAASDYTEPYSNMSSMDRHHLDHCIDYLRQTLMCHGDMTMMPYTYDPVQIPPIFPKFEHLRTCRSWDAIWDWALLKNNTGYGI